MMTLLKSLELLLVISAANVEIMRNIQLSAPYFWNTEPEALATVESGNIKPRSVDGLTGLLLRLWECVEHRCF